MAFKLKPFYDIDSTPVYSVDLEEGVHGKANNNGTILIDKDVNIKDKKEVIKHELVHINQIKDGILNYDDKNVYYKGKTFPRSKMKEGAKNLPWEKDAYNV